MAENDNQMLKKGEGADFASFDPSKKKKKKKVVIHDTAESSVGRLVEKTKSVVDDQVKKDEDKENNVPVNSNEEGDGIVIQGRCPWESSDRDYKYEELLSRVFDSHDSGVRRRIVLRPPVIVREGSKKTVYVNFADTCKSLQRDPDHVMSFFLTELSTTGSIDGRHRLILNGRFPPKSFEGLLRQYFNEYVICNACKYPETILVKENRINFLRCERELCGSKRSVLPIKAGFNAVKPRRAGGRNGGKK